MPVLDSAESISFNTRRNWGICLWSTEQKVDTEPLQSTPLANSHDAFAYTIGHLFSHFEVSELSPCWAHNSRDLVAHC